MPKCSTCDDNGYKGLKAHESFNGFDESTPCPDCALRRVVGAGKEKYSLKLGTHATSSHLRRGLLLAKRQMNTYADQILSIDTTITVSSIRRSVELITLPLSQYNFGTPLFTINDVIRIGLQRCYKPCTAEMTAQFILQYPKPPPAKMLIFGMAPFMYTGYIWVFIITNNEEGYSLRAVHHNVQVLSAYPPGVQKGSDVLTLWLA